jgi:sec-independent protein translocase protein TatA
MGSIGLPEMLVILVIVLVIFGAGKLPDVGSALGKAIRGFKKGMEEPELPSAKPKDAEGEKDKKV